MFSLLAKINYTAGRSVDKLIQIHRTSLFGVPDEDLKTAGSCSHVYVIGIVPIPCQLETSPFGVWCVADL